MLKLVSKLLILLCLWNVTIGVFPGFSTDVERGEIISAQQDSGITLSVDSCDATDDHQANDVSCSACHLGHCQFIARTADATIQFIPTLGNVTAKQFVPNSFYPSSPIKPPSA